MGKTIKINESQFNTIINRPLKEDLENENPDVISKNLIKAILRGGILYDKDCPEIGENAPTLVCTDGKYTVFLIGTTDSKPFISSSYNPGNYYTEPEGGDIEWNPKYFYINEVYGIYDNERDEFEDDIDFELFRIIEKNIYDTISKVPITYPNYEVIINSEDIEDSDTSDLEYDNYRDRQFN